MAGPWEKYQQPAQAQANTPAPPWAKYAGAPPIPEPPSTVLEGGTARLYRRQGMSEPPPPPDMAEKALPYLPVAGGALGGMVGGPVGAVAGGMGGAAMQKALESKNATEQGQNPPPPGVGTAMDIGWEGLKQGAYELGGRLLNMGGKILGRKLSEAAGKAAPETVGTTIKGTTIPETAGQAFGEPGGLGQKVEHYLSGTWLGGPLRAVREAQETATRGIVAKLSQLETPNPSVLAENWQQAREVVRATAQPIYQKLEQVEAPEVGKIANEILGDTSLRLSPKAKAALQATMETRNPEQQAALEQLDKIAQGVGGKDARSYMMGGGGATGTEASQYLRRVAGEDVWNAATKTQPSSVGDALQARHELGDLASSAKDPNDARMLWQAKEKMDNAINNALTPEQLEMKQQADLLWRRSYIMNRVAKGLQKMEAVQDPNQAPKVITSGFVKMVNKLAQSDISRTADGTMVRRPSDLEILYEKPEDRQAMKDLASFLIKKHATLSGASGISESLANLGTAIEAIHLPMQVATGHLGMAAKAGTYLAGLAGLSKALANPGGARLALQYFRSPAAAQTALAARIVGTTARATEPPPGTPELPKRTGPFPLMPPTMLPYPIPPPPE